ncbi:diaminopimelate decarboxylase [Hazenella sp. IB182357]|uniref:Diaminopimelate decarboxylase n=1 Tax=Polycladospora coralii TaxID=2771432 RepID=A0A926N962_9BACL|nr:diaminopimelate decarboxylase [Polycladospora coralii]MBD1371682.1 diaminopimelate decarboxylase [Polycladospora coralii]MBS7529149.1 diaminopimelate decarboxylase [Polycladospora coralii]
MYLHGTSRTNKHGHLEIGGCSSVELVEQYGTPLYVMDEKLIRSRMREFVHAFEETSHPFQMAYASKAFSTMAMCKIVEEEGFLLDVVSEGELYTALKAGFPAERIYMHGNNKSISEMEMGIKHRIGWFVVDNLNELTMLQQIAASKDVSVRILLRIKPGITAHTHQYIQTGQEDSKFGLDLTPSQAYAGVQQALQSSHIELDGFHCHIGSQIFDVEGFVHAIKRMTAFAHHCHQMYGLQTNILNLGGGFGVRYQESDSPLPISQYVKQMVKEVQAGFQNFDWVPEIWLEPGRRIVGEAGTTLYTIGTVKEIPNIRKYVAVDGGMTDNLRPALYQAQYEAMLANRAFEPVSEVVSIAGKCCESGDMLIWDVSLPPVRTGDTLAVSCTGAYHYALANNYNRLRRPAIVFVNDGTARLVVQRESLDDLIRLEQAIV